MTNKNKQDGAKLMNDVERARYDFECAAAELATARRKWLDWYSSHASIIGRVSALISIFLMDNEFTIGILAAFAMGVIVGAFNL